MATTIVIIRQPDREPVRYEATHPGSLETLKSALADVSADVLAANVGLSQFTVAQSKIPVWTVISIGRKTKPARDKVLAVLRRHGFKLTEIEGSRL